MTKNNYKNTNNSIKVAIDNAKIRINLLSSTDRKCVIEEYKEWINGDLNQHKVLFLREDPII